MGVRHVVLSVDLEGHALVFSKRRVSVVFLVAFTVILVVAGVAGSTRGFRGSLPTSGHAGFDPVQYSSGVGDIADVASIKPGSVDDDLAALLERVGDPLLDNARIDKAPSTDESAGGNVVAFRLRVAGQASIKEVWKAELVAGALR